MKRYAIFMVIAAAALAAGCDKPDDGPDVAPEEEQPVIRASLEGNMLVVPAEGGQASIPYVVEFPAENGMVTAEAAGSWLDSFDCSVPGEVKFNVQPNEEPSGRSSIVTIIYSYGDRDTVSAQVNVVQDAGMAYDYEFEMTMLSGVYYGTQYSQDGEYNFNIWAHDKDFLNGYIGSTDYGGTDYLFDIFGPEPEDTGNPFPAAGTYTLGDYLETEEMTFAPATSCGKQLADDGTTVFNAYFNEGTLTVSYEGNNTVIEAVLTDGQGLTHHITATAPVTYDIRDGDISIKEDLDYTATIASATYVDDRDGVMSVKIKLSDMTADAGGLLYPPGAYTEILAYMPYDGSVELAVGTYRTDASGEAMTCAVGYIVDTLGIITYEGTYARYMTEDWMSYWSCIVSGTMTVTGGAGEYSIVCDYLTAEGRSVKCTYDGPLAIAGLPLPFSAMSGDNVPFREKLRRR